MLDARVIAIYMFFVRVIVICSKIWIVIINYKTNDTKSLFSRRFLNKMISFIKVFKIVFYRQQSRRARFVANQPKSQALLLRNQRHQQSRKGSQNRIYPNRRVTWVLLDTLTNTAECTIANSCANIRCRRRTTSKHTN